MSARPGEDALVRDLVEVLCASVDGAELRRRLRGHFAGAEPPARAPSSRPPKADGAMSEAARKLQSRIGLADILDESILEARSGDRAFPLRLFFGELVQRAGDDDLAFALASGLNLYFRAAMSEEAKVSVGLEVSRLYYRFASANLDEEVTVRLSPLLAKLMSHELGQLALESIDHVRVFDSAVHERDSGSDETSATIVAPKSFLCRVAASTRPRFKALVAT
jgi:hypothetical protein